MAAFGLTVLAGFLRAVERPSSRLDEPFGAVV
jgi:hypothetical protein